MSELYELLRDHTMIPEKTFDANIFLVSEFADVDGCVVECGVWKGGMIAGIAATLGLDREYYLFDSFEGLPPAQKIDGIDAALWQQTNPDNCKADVMDVVRAMSLVDIPRFNVVPGWFEDTLPKFDSPIAILRLDGDWFFSTMACFVNLYDHVVHGGLIIIDDFFAWDGCRRAVLEFFKHRDVTLQMNVSTGMCWMVKP